MTGNSWKKRHCNVISQSYISTIVSVNKIYIDAIPRSCIYQAGVMIATPRIYILCVSVYYNKYIHMCLYLPHILRKYYELAGSFPKKNLITNSQLARYHINSFHKTYNSRKHILMHGNHFYQNKNTLKGGGVIFWYIPMALLPKFNLL